MLIALDNQVRTEAGAAEKGPAYVCPNCRCEVILKKGRVVVHHFAHKPPATCLWAAGETLAHLKAKTVLRDAMIARGLRAEVECEVLSAEGDRRADVLVWGRKNSRLAFEVQHQPLDFGTIDRRTRAYMAAGVPVVWLSLLSTSALVAAETTPTGLVIHRYSVRPWEKWAHAYGMGELWFIDPASAQLWRGVMKAHLIEVPYYEYEGVGGYTYASKRWRGLYLTGPFDPAKVRIKPFRRAPWSGKAFSLPGGPAAKLEIPPDADIAAPAEGSPHDD